MMAGGVALLLLLNHVENNDSFPVNRHCQTLKRLFLFVDGSVAFSRTETLWNVSL